MPSPTSLIPARLKQSVLVTLISAIPPLAGAQTAVTIYSSAQPGSLNSSMFRSGGESGSVPGYAVVRQEREINTAKGRSVIRISDVAASIDPTTVSFESLTDPTGTRVIEQSFEFDLTSTRKLLDKYLDREVSVEQIRGNAVESITGVLQSARDGLVLRLADGSLRTVSQYAGVRLASLPGGLISKPTLVWDILAEREGSQRARVGYQTTGITWWTDYNVTLNDDKGCRLDLGAWVTIVNQSGAVFDNAKLKLVAGDVQRAQAPAQEIQYAASPRAAMMKADAGFQEKSFFEYHLYTLGRPTTLANNATKQIELFPAARGVSCEKQLVYAGQGISGGYSGLITDRNFTAAGNKKVDVLLRFDNRESNRLGVPLPAGKVRVSKVDAADASLEFVGEDLIDHTPRNETVKLKLGSAFDVIGERRQVDFRIDNSARWMEEDIEVKIRNQKAEPVTVLVREYMMRWTNWSILRKSADFSKLDSRNIQFKTEVPKEGESVIRYTVRYTW